MKISTSTSPTSPEFRYFAAVLMPMYRYCFFLVFLTFYLLSTQGQPNVASMQLQPPLAIPLYLSGTFAELRSDHFHSGVDFRTQGVEGQKVLAIADGYVSRVAVSPTGFGKVLYIVHPGLDIMSVYAHLQGFSPDVAAYVKAQQYKQQAFGVNLFPEKDQFRLKKGDVIGLSGNSGSSGGPHLHFEIRDAATQEVLNPLDFGFSVKDFIRPNILRFAVYPENETAIIEGENAAKLFEVQGWGEVHRINDNKPIQLWGKVSFGISTHDTHNDTPNKNGVYSIELLIDSTKIFGFTADRFAFDETRYINSMIDYGHFIREKNRVIRSKIDPQNALGMYNHSKGNGSFQFNEERDYQLVYTVKDFHGNVSKLNVSLQARRPDTAFSKAGNKADSLHFLAAGKAHQFNEKNFTVHIPPDALYKDEKFGYRIQTDSSSFAETYCFGSPEIPLHKAAQFRMALPETVIPDDKLLVVQMNDDKEPQPIGGKPEKGWMGFSTRKLGCFSIVPDTVPPTIVLKNARDGKLAENTKRIRFEIDDALSGIGKIEPLLNGSWLLMEYDPKNKLLFYEVDERMLKGNNSFVLTVWDKQGNHTVFKKTFTRF